MNDDIFTDKPDIPASRKALLEFKDILAGVAFPMIVTLVISTSVTMFASYTAELAVSLIALIGGEIMMTGALVMFGRANGSAAYSKTLLNAQKRELGSTDERVLCKTGEYALWKAILIPLIVCLPFIIIQTIELIVDNKGCMFCLQYMCGWAYFPFSYLGKDYQALGYIMIILPVGAHMLGYYLGKIKRMKSNGGEDYGDNPKRRRK